MDGMSEDGKTADVGSHHSSESRRESTTDETLTKLIKKKTDLLLAANRESMDEVAATNAALTAADVLGEQQLAADEENEHDYDEAHKSFDYSDKRLTVSDEQWNYLVPITSLLHICIARQRKQAQLLEHSIWATITFFHLDRHHKKQLTQQQFTEAMAPCYNRGLPPSDGSVPTWFKTEQDLLAMYGDLIYVSNDSLMSFCTFFDSTRSILLDADRVREGEPVFKIPFMSEDEMERAALEIEKARRKAAALANLNKYV
jgi:hypothetical protein